jgi:alkanesulfonate monooxygenase SsuD/methylene tetrahydromethanopterin reductase-like flavin-dependent oxidoreductase (luciferase family)
MPSADLKLGVSLSTDHTNLLARARHAEDLGLESVWLADVLIGDGSPSLEAIVGLSAVAAVTSRVRLGFGTLVLPIRPLALLGAQIQGLQHISDGRLLLGIGSGGYFEAPFWQATGVPRTRRGRLTDAALVALPGLIGGRETTLDGGNALTLAPPAKVPPILVGGSSSVAIRRAVEYGDAWFPSLITPRMLAAGGSQLREAAETAGRTAPGVTVGGNASLGEVDRSAREAFVRVLTETYSVPAEEAGDVPIDGSPRQVAEHLAALADAGAERVVIAFGGNDWMRQAELLAEAHALLA